MKHVMRDELGEPKIVDQSIFRTELDALRVREKPVASSQLVSRSYLRQVSNWLEEFELIDG